jgi:hypothetical protein
MRRQQMRAAVIAVGAAVLVPAGGAAAQAGAVAGRTVQHGAGPTGMAALARPAGPGAAVWPVPSVAAGERIGPVQRQDRSAGVLGTGTGRLETTGAGLILLGAGIGLARAARRHLLE